ncbi:MAG: glycosyltransferase family 1 protein [Porphyrobacter sp.]|nr:glycosyltransferase family 1 protein [Porphyrobacter sp.]
MRIALVTDAWDPQVNGVVRTLHALTDELVRRGHEVEVIAPCQFRSWPCPSYPEIRLALAGSHAVGERLAAFRPEAIHISTEGPLGWAARRWCLAHGRQFTTAYHTQFPEYLARRSHLPAAVFWPYIRHFHAPSSGIMAATSTLREQLAAHGLTRLRPWGRGVDLDQFGQDMAPPDLFLQLPRPIQLYVGRVAVEKNVESFLATPNAGSKVVVGDGPALSRLQAEFPEAIFLGRQSGRALAACYAGADVFVFPSRTDTFGLVMIEALASGTPVAAYPVPGPIDVLTSESGCMAETLEQAIAGALQLDRARCREHGRSFTWEASTDQFLAALTPECPQQAPQELRAA